MHARWQSSRPSSTIPRMKHRRERALSPARAAAIAGLPGGASRGGALALACLLGLAAWAGPVRAQDVRITEVLAVNDGGLEDEDGNHPDWIELLNDSGATIDLAGWRLTDDRLDPVKWLFPSEELAAGERLVVFASGKDRRPAAGWLHTNFRIPSEDGYVALIRPDDSVASEVFPGRQYRNISFGAEDLGAAHELLGDGSAARLQVPSVADSNSAWQVIAFNDDSWQDVVLGVGFDRAGGGGGTVLAVDFNERGADADQTTQPGFMPFLIDAEGGSQAIQSGAVTRNFGGLTVTLSGDAIEPGYDDRLRDTPGNAGAFTESLLLRDFLFSRARESAGGLTITIAGLPAQALCRFRIWSFDTGSVGSREAQWLANDQVVHDRWRFNGAELPTTNDRYRFEFVAAADPQGMVRLEGWRLETSTSSGNSPDFGVFINALEVEAPGLGGLFRTDVESLMFGKNASARLRVPFFAPAGTFSGLRLEMLYDDGFVAWLNGVPLAADNAPAPLAWDASALAPLPQESVIEPSPYSVAADALRPGAANVLAIQGLNAAAADPDFLVTARLLAQPSAGQSWAFYSEPTPGEPNGEGRIGVVESPVFNIERGLYEQPVTLALGSSTAGAQIWYTLDGTVPGPGNGQRYTEPFAINSTAAVGAVAVRDNWISSEVVTHTYLFPAEVPAQPVLPEGYPDRWQADYVADYEMDPALVSDPGYGPRLPPSLRSFPSLFLTLPHDDLWGSAAGIYRDSTSRGDAWERAVSAELLLPDGRSGTTGFAVNAGLRIQGDASRDNNRTPKHSLRLLFKGDYGPSKLAYDWFGGGVTEFDNIVLRAGFTDSWCTRYSPGGNLGERYRPEDSVYLRDTWMKDTSAAMGNPAGRGTFVHLYLNGLYWGLYNPTERLDASHFSEACGGRELDWDVIRDFGEVMDGDKQDWNLMIATVNAGIDSEADYQAVRAWVDVPNLIDYMLLHFFGEAEDWPHHNWYGARHKGEEVIRGNRWFFLPWDQEIVADRQQARNRVGVNNDDTPARIYSQLRAWPEFRREFGDRVQLHLGPGGALSIESNVERLRQRAAVIAPAMVAESVRWGDARREATVGSQGTDVTLTPDEFWQPEIDALCTNWFPAQPEVLLTRLRQANLFPTLDAPVLDPPGGFVSASGGVSAKHANSGGTIYFTDDGSDPREYGTGAVATTAQPWSGLIRIAAPVELRARVWRDGEWSALVSASYRPEQDFSGLQFSEIHYHPLPFLGIDGDRFEFLELGNTGIDPLYLEGTRIVEGIEFTFSAAVVLAPGEHTVVVSDPAAFALLYPEVQPAGSYDQQLSNGGERIGLRDPLGDVLPALEYDDSAPWPGGADGDGWSLQWRPDLGATGNPAAWVAAVPTPGEALVPAGNDRDGDGLPDSWEDDRGTDPDVPDADADADADGSSNAAERAAGTDPRDASDRLEVLEVTPQPGGTTLALRFRAVAGRLYRVESNAALRSPIWSPLVDLPARGTGQDQVVEAPWLSSGARFFRIRVLDHQP